MFQNNLNVAVVQMNLIWEDVYANRLIINNKINSIYKKVDVIILPEMFTSGFTMNASKIAEPIHGKTISWLKKIAKEKQVAIIGSLIISDREHYYNSMICINPNGNITQYNKKHTFTLAGEHKVYKSGSKKVIFQYKGWKICPLVCYDLRFPVWSRNTEDYDVLVYVANWPKPRINAWDTLLKARAIENMSYCIGVNRIGFDANGNEYPGHSAVYDVLGKRLDTIPKNKEITEIIMLNKKHIKDNREKLGFLSDRDSFNLIT